jgi:hypothetical protein
VCTFVCVIGETKPSIVQTALSVTTVAEKYVDADFDMLIILLMVLK